MSRTRAPLGALSADSVGGIRLDARAPCPCRAGSRAGFRAGMRAGPSRGTARHPNCYGDCCAPLHQGGAAPTAEALMRSRYSAFVLEDRDYLFASWHPTTRPERIDFDPDKRWLGLTVRAVVAGGDSDDLGTVEFVARYRIKGRATRLHELSEFVRAEGRWVYVRGHPAPARRAGRG